MRSLAIVFVLDYYKNTNRIARGHTQEFDLSAQQGPSMTVRAGMNDGEG